MDPKRDTRAQRSHELFGMDISGVTKYYYLFLALVIASVVICYRLERSRSGRARKSSPDSHSKSKA